MLRAFQAGKLAHIELESANINLSKDLGLEIMESIQAISVIFD